MSLENIASNSAWAEFRYQKKAKMRLHVFSLKGGRVFSKESVWQCPVELAPDCKNTTAPG